MDTSLLDNCTFKFCSESSQPQYIIFPSEYLLRLFIVFLPGWFMRTLGAHYVTSLVFFLYIFRLLGLAVVGAYGPVWATLLVELLNGPCYGLGYTAIVIYSSKLSPPGTSTTVQSIVNICYEILGEHWIG